MASPKAGPARTPGASSIDLRKLFMASLLIGAVGILAGQWLGNIIIAVSLPLAVMAIYIAVGFRLGTVDVILEQFADSIYYLGFLFTLLALVVSLYAFRADSLAIGQLVGNFALALVTTITGLASRIIITNFRSDEGSARRQLRDELEESTRQLILNARSFSLRLEALNNEVHFTLNNAIQEASRGLAASATTLQQQQQDSAAAMTREVSDAGQTLAHSVQQVQQQLARIELPQDIFSARLHQPLDELTQRFSQQQQAIDALMAQHSGVLERATEVNTGLQHSAAHIDTLEAAIAGLAQRLDDDQRARADIAQLSEQMRSLLAQQQRLSESMGQQADSTDRATAGLAALITDMDGIRGQLAASSDALVQGGEQIGAVVANLSADADRSEAINSNIGLIANALQQAREQLEPITGIGDQLQQQSSRYADIEQLSQAQLTLLKQHQQELEQILAASRDSLQQVNQHFVEAARYVSDRLGD